MGTTTNGLPWPEGTDRVADGDDAIRALAESIDGKLLLSGDTGWLTPAAAGFAVMAGWKDLSGTVRKRHGFVFVNLAASSINPIGASNISNVPAISVPGSWRPYLNSPVTTTSAGISHSSYVSGGAPGSSGGAVIVSATQVATPANYVYTFGGMWAV